MSSDHPGDAPHAAESGRSPEWKPASKIAAVTVHADSAVVRRECFVPTVEGERVRKVRIARLPLALVDASVQVRAVAADGAGSAVRVLDAVVRLEGFPAGGDGSESDERETPRALRELEAELALWRERLDARRKSKQDLLEAKLRARPESTGRTNQHSRQTLRSRLRFADFLEARRAKVQASCDEAAREIERLEEKKTKLLRDETLAHDDARRRGPKFWKDLVVTLETLPQEESSAGLGSPPPAAGELPAGTTLQIEYLVPGVRWYPLYRLRFNQTLDQAELTLRAGVLQSTGESWDQVELTVASTHPVRPVQPAVLPSLRLGRAQQRPETRGWREPPTFSEEWIGELTRMQSAAREAALRLARGGDEDGDAEGALALPPTDRTGSGTEIYSPTSAASADYAAVARGGMVRGFAAEAPSTRAPDTAFGAAVSAVYAKKPEPPRPPAASAAAAPIMMSMAAPMQDAAPRARRALASSAPGTVGAATAGAEKLFHAFQPEDTDADGWNWQDPSDFLNYQGLRMIGPSMEDADLPRGRLVFVDEIRDAARRLGCEPMALRRGLRAAERDEPGASASLPTYARVCEFQPGLEGSRTARGRCSVPSSGQYHVVTLDEIPLKFEMRFVAVPRTAREAFRVMEWKNPQPQPLLEGPVDVLIEGAYWSTVRLPNTPAKAKCELGLGVEDGIKLYRNARYKESATRLTGALELQHQITVDISNHLPQPVTLEVRERTPVSEYDADKVSVRVHAAAPPWQPFTQDEPGGCKGGFRWIVQLPPGGKQSLVASYTIGIWSNEELVGGNRREE